MLQLHESASPSTSSQTSRWRFRAITLAALAAIAATSWFGCSSPATPPFCPGGYVTTVNGVKTCSALCEPSLCANPGNVCVDNECALQCTSHLDCPSGQSCLPAKEDGTGAAITTCQSNGLGGIGTPCPFGTECASVKTCGDGTPCPASGSCTVGTCQALTCLTQGSGDAQAYCTLNDCTANTDCPPGWACDTVVDPHQICGAAAPPAYCGTTTEPCVDPSKNAANGTTWAAGKPCTTRNQCRPLAQCDPCTTDLDCSLVPGRHCTQGNCADDCATDADCENGFVCTAGECVPRSGSCGPTSPGTAPFCGDCRTEADCATGFFCSQLIAGGERVCINVDATSCTQDSDCPKAVSGLYAICADSRLYLQPGEAGYDTCYYAPYSTGDDKFACWCGNTGTTCDAGDECCSKSCVGANATTGQTGLCK
jgi:hypothetical protein